MTERDNFINMLTRANVGFKYERDDINKDGSSSIWIDIETIAFEFYFNNKGYLLGVDGYRKPDND